MNLGPTNDDFCLDCGQGWQRHAGPICPPDIEAAIAWERAANPPWMRVLAVASAVIAVAAVVVSFAQAAS